MRASEARGYSNLLVRDRTVRFLHVTDKNNGQTLGDST
jgi:hypothetical protein